MIEPDDRTRTAPPADGPPATVTATPAPSDPADEATRAKPSTPTFGPSGTALPTVSGYVIMREIARGGMGVVFLADDPVFGRKVAVKVMHPGQDADRFVTESKITAQLPHPGIPPVYALGELPDARPYLAMKLVEGRTLADELKVADLAAELPRLVGLFESICQTVGFAHSRGIIHRDLKPANVMVGAFGEVLVMDWGLARRAWSDGSDSAEESSSVSGSGSRVPRSDETQAGQVKGTPAYMAPEQARGEPVDARADVFALGGILAAVLTGQPPFRGETVHDTVRLAARGDLAEHFARLGACGADAELVALAKRCLAPAAIDRYADGAEVAAAVAAYRAGVEERLRRAERDRAVSEAEAREQRKRRKVQLALAAAIGLFLAVGGAVAWYSDRQAEGRRQAAALREARTRDAVGASIEQTEAALRAGDAERAAEALAQADARAAEGGADDLAPRLDRCRAELDTLRRFDAVATARWTTTDQLRLLTWKELAPRLARTFAEFGIVPGAGSPDEAARRINTASIRESLLAYLEIWAAAGDGGPDVRAILTRADPDPFRDAVRAGHYRTVAMGRGIRGEPIPSPPVWFALGQGQNPALHILGREQILTAALHERPNSIPILLALAATGLGTNKESAPRRVGACRAALAVQPRNVIAWNNLAIALREGGDLRGAIAAYRRALEIDGRSAAVWNNLGNALSAAGDREAALRAFDSALTINSNYPQAHTNRGVVLMNLGRLSEAAEAHERALAGNDGFADAHYNLGLVLIRRGDWPRAVAECRRATELADDHPAAFNNLGVALRFSGDPKGARAAYLEAIKLGGKDAVNCSNVAQTYFDERDYVATIEWADKAIAQDKKWAQAHGLRGWALLWRGERSAAFEALSTAEELAPGDWKGAKKWAQPIPAPAPHEK